MKEMLRVTLRGSPCILVKVGLDVGSKGNVHLRAYRKDLEFISKASKAACLNKWLDIIECLRVVFKQQK